MGKSKAKTKKRSAAPDNPAPGKARGRQTGVGLEAGLRGSREPVSIVGVGASAGGLEAFTQLLSHLPNRSGMAFVLVQHLAPWHESALPDLLRRATEIPVQEVKDGLPVEPDHIYIIPPNASMAIVNGVLHLMPRTPAQIHLPIDFFLTSLAQDRGNRAIGVILSGTASDGTQGMRAIKAEGGITFAQDEQSARYGDMPRNAVASGCVDFVLPPEAIARELVRIAEHPFRKRPHQREDAEKSAEGSDLVKIFVLLRTATGVDFTHYKQSTVRRRIKRRMVLHKMQDLKAYLKYMEQHPPEADALFQDILIHVTGFFRDPEIFDALKDVVFPSLMKDRPAEAPIRIWVPACSSGEEVYSIAICLLEFLGHTADSADIQIFATDISEPLLDKARAGFYTEDVLADVSPERRRRFFVRNPKGYHIGKSIREMCVFARQDAVRDPPFSRLDLISCRNLLIYLGGVLQKRLLPIFHYALRPSGFLLLGNSETIGSFADLFSVVDRKHKIYAKRAIAAHLPAEFSRLEHPGDKVQPIQRAEGGSNFDVQKETDRILLAKYAPPGVVVNSDLEILQFRGRTGLFLEPASGHASLSLPKMAREGMLVDIRAAIQKAKKEDRTVRKRGLRVRVNDHNADVDIEVTPIKGPTRTERYFLVLFQQPAAPEKALPAGEKTRTAAARRRAELRQTDHLRDELAHTKSSLQSIIEEQETTNEELKSANEEILSSNEELQSTNEELETAKEELQSANEELTTLNEELHTRNLELGVVNNDLLNLLANANIPILMLGNDLRIRRFSPQVEKLLNLISHDVGRPIGDIKPNMDLPGFEEMIIDAIDNVTIREREVQDRIGRWYSMRVRPYKTMENKIDGVVITWIDINALKVSLEQAAQYAQAIVETTRDSLVVLDDDLRVKSANPAFYTTFGLLPQQAENRLFSEVAGGRWNDSRLLALLKDVFARQIPMEGFEMTQELADGGGRHRMLLSGRVIKTSTGSSFILLSIADLSILQQAEQARVTSEERYQLLLRRNLAGVYRSTPAGVILDCNESLARTLGYDSPAAVLRREAWDLFVSADDRKAFVAELKEGGIPLNREMRLRRADGTAASVLMNAVLVDFEGEPERVIEGIVLDISDRKEAERKQLALSGQLIDLQDQERRKVSRDLHDTISSSLTALVANLARIKRASRTLNRDGQEALEESLQLAKECSREIRTISYLLHPPLLDELGLESALRWLTDGFAKRSGVDASLDIAPGLGRLPREIETALFRVVQESLTNIHLHSKSAVARIRLALNGAEAALEVSDSGRGMKRGAHDSGKFSNRGVGIPGMQERMKQLGGRLEIESSRKGTTVRAIIPLHARAPSVAIS